MCTLINIIINILKYIEHFETKISKKDITKHIYLDNTNNLAQLVKINLF